jgi:formylglycine-generating enzyme required for sulfatase activity
MLRPRLRAAAVLFLVIAAVPPSGSSQRSAPATAPVDAKASQTKNGSDDFSPPGMMLVKKGPFLSGTTMREAQEIEQYFRIGRRQKDRFWSLIGLEIVDEKHRRQDVDAFYFDRFECPNLQYYHYMKATGAAAPNIPNDKVAQWREGRLPGFTQLYFPDEVKKWTGLTKRLTSGATAKNALTPIGRVWSLLGDDLQTKLKKGEPDVPAELQKELTAALNRLVESKDFYDERFFRGIGVPEAATLAAKGLDRLDAREMQRFNRLFLDVALKDVVEEGQPLEAIYFPVTGLTFFQAKACAEWMGKRLPTEMEWEKAARGPDDARWFPWGNEFGNKQIDYCNWALYWVSELNKDRRPAGLCPVGSFPKGVSPYGAMDMIGNALEFTDDPWQPHPGAVTSRVVSFNPPPSDSYAVIKGGAYGEQFKENLRVAFRFGMHKAETSDAVGFRCSKDVKVGQTALAKIARDLFASFWDDRLINIDLENGTDCREKTAYDEGHRDHAIITDYKWIGFVNIRDHLFDSEKSLLNASDKLKRKNMGHIFLGVFHTDVPFTDPPLPPGSYAIMYQRGFKLLAEQEDKAGAGKEGEEEKAGKKETDKDKKDKDKKDKDKKKAEDRKKKPAKKKGTKVEEPPGAAVAPPQEAAPKPAAAPVAPRPEVPAAAPIPRILFVDASGKLVAAVDKFEVRMVRTADRARLSFVPPNDKSPATAYLHLAMLKKYEKAKFLVVDVPIYTQRAADLEGWRE